MSVASTTGSVSSEAVPRKKSGAAAFLGALAGVVLVGVGAAAAAVYLVRPTGEAHVPAHATSVDRAAAAPTAPPAGPRAGDSAGVSAAAPPTSASVAASPKTVTTRQIGVPGAPRATTPAAAPAAPGRPVSAATQPSAAAAAPPIAQPPATTPSAAPPPPSRPASPPASGGLPTHFQVD
jgi:hypothetical protein